MLGLFAVLNLTELSYAIIFTGPGRRNAHREQAEQAELEGYMLGEDAGRNRNQENESDENYDVQTQSLLDDSNLKGASFGSGQFGQKFSQMSPEEKAALREKFQQKFGNGKFGNGQFKQRFQNLQQSSANDDVVTQSLQEEQEPSHEEMIADIAQQAAQEDQALTDQVQENFEQAAQVAQQLADVVPGQQADVQESVALQQPPVASQSSEKIVKVYPVYEALQAGFVHLKCAAQDMINYVYSFFGGQKAEVQVQCYR